jgi:hypothetical protein
MTERHTLQVSNPETAEKFQVFGTMESIQYIQGLLESIETGTYVLPVVNPR